MEKKGTEDYMRVIYELGKGKEVKSVDIASKLGISKPSVSEMLRKLADRKLIKIKPYSKIQLSSLGEKFAKEVIDKHNIIEEFIKKAFKYEEQQAHNEAHALEHAFSDDSILHLREIVNGKLEKSRKENEKILQKFAEDNLIYIG